MHGVATQINHTYLASISVLNLKELHLVQNTTCRQICKYFFRQIMTNK